MRLDVPGARRFIPDDVHQIADELGELPFDWMDTHPVRVVAASNLLAVRGAPRAVRMMLVQPMARRGHLGRPS